MYSETARYMNQYGDITDEFFVIREFINDHTKKLEKMEKNISTYETDLVQMRDFVSQLEIVISQMETRIENIDHTQGNDMKSLTDYYRDQIRRMDKIIDIVKQDIASTHNDLVATKTSYSEIIQSLVGIHKILSEELDPELKEKYTQYLPE